VTAAILCFATAVGTPARAIVGGLPDGNLHPEVGALVGYDPAEGEYFTFCSGTLISPTVFLTASHCTLALTAYMGSAHAWVTFDPVFDPDTVTLLPGAMYSNPDYGHDFARVGDVAVLVLDAPAAGITPASLPTEGLLDGMKDSLHSMEFTAVGYGASRTDKTGGPNAIYYNDDRQYATQSFLALNRNWLRLSMNVSTGSGGTCYGDSGGPHFIGAGADETNIVVSVTVTGDSVCRATDTTYRVDTPAAREFLGQFVTLP
jgi:hypothetical protein